MQRTLAADTAQSVVLSPVEKQAITARCEKATPGPWASYAWVGGDRYEVITADGTLSHPARDVAHRLTEADANFIAASITDLPRVLAVLEGVEAENEKLRKALRHVIDIAGERFTLNLCNSCDEARGLVPSPARGAGEE